MFRNMTFATVIESRFSGELKWKIVAVNIASWLAVVAVAYVLAGSILSSSHVSILLFLSAVVFVIALTNELHGYVAAMILTFYTNYVVNLLSLASVYLMLPYVVILSLVARRFGDTLLHVSVVRSPLNNVVVLLSMFAVISLGLNNNPFGTALKGMVQHLSFILLSLVVANSNLSESALKKIIYGIGAIAFAQIPASVIQYYFIYVDYPVGARTDQSAGLLGFSSGDVNAVFMTFMLSLLFSAIVNVGVKFKYIVGIALLLVPIILSSARAGILFFLITSLFLSGLVPFLQKRNRLYKTGGALLGAAVVAGGILLIAKPHQISFVTNPAYIYKYSIQRSDSGLGRLQALGFVHNTIGKDWIKSVVGYGPGAIIPTRFLGRDRSDLYASNNDLLSNYNDYAFVALELGYGGLVLMFYSLYRVFMFNKTFYNGCNDKFWRAVSFGLAGIIFTSAYSIIYTRSWTRPPLAFCLWFLAGAITRMSYLKGLSTNPSVPPLIRLGR